MIELRRPGSRVVWGSGLLEPFLHRTHHCIGDAENENGDHDARQGDRDATNSEAEK